MSSKPGSAVLMAFVNVICKVHMEVVLRLNFHNYFHTVWSHTHYQARRTQRWKNERYPHLKGTITPCYVSFFASLD